MAVISGYGIQTSILSLDIPVTSDISSNMNSISRNLTKTVIEQSAVNLQTSYTKDLTPTFVFTGLGQAKVTSFVDDFYNRIHISPRYIDVGNLVSEQFVTAEIFNAYFNQKELTNIFENGTTGIIISGIVTPYLIAPLFTDTFNITIGVNGPADIKGQFLFNFEGVNDDIAITIVGSRIISIVWPYEAPAQESLNWKTDIVTSNDGTEQRIRLRKHPRQGFKLSYPLKWPDIPEAENRLYGWLSRRWAVPLWSESQFVGSINSGQLIVNIDTTKSDFRAGTLAYIYESSDKNFTVEIDTISSTYLTLKLPLNANYSNAYVMPSRIGRISGVPTRKNSGYESSLEIGFDILDNLDLGLGTSPTQFLNEDIYFEPTLLGETLDDQYVTRLDVIDYEIGSSSSFSPWKYIQKKRPHKYILQGMEDIWSFRQWLHRRAGRQKPFWIPSFEPDMRLDHTDLITTSFYVEDNDYYAFSMDRKHIAVLLTDGTWLPRTITTVTKDVPGRIQIVIDTSLGNISPSLIKQISYLTLKRLDSDKVDLQWGNNRVLVASILVAEIAP